MNGCPVICDFSTARGTQVRMIDVFWRLRWASLLKRPAWILVAGPVGGAAHPWCSPDKLVLLEQPVDPGSFQLAKKPSATKTQHVLVFPARSEAVHSGTLSHTQKKHTHGSAELLPVSWERALALLLVLPEWCIAPSVSLPLVSPPLLFSEPSDAVSLSGRQGQGASEATYEKQLCPLCLRTPSLTQLHTRVHTACSHSPLPGRTAL